MRSGAPPAHDVSRVAMSLGIWRFTIQAEGYQGCESRVRQHLAAWREAHHPPELFLPLEFEPGQDAQVDWDEAVAIVGGQRQKVQFFVMHLC